VKKSMLSLQNFTKNSSHGWGDLFFFWHQY